MLDVFLTHTALITAYNTQYFAANRCAQIILYERVYERRNKLEGGSILNTYTENVYVVLLYDGFARIARGTPVTKRSMLVVRSQKSRFRYRPGLNHFHVTDK